MEEGMAELERNENYVLKMNRIELLTVRRALGRMTGADYTGLEMQDAGHALYDLVDKALK